ncbi:hypothetical protein HK100_002604 [Physocladia obscura]|uniref:BRISC and BRCA1-A complex member 2 n=1 Tax=Physocladia obscura TaxID=109957 RepID=A0AAD5SVJ5_9FUNG|nr:hypothetical protein HK100_002604 [Physocladia obscura]
MEVKGKRLAAFLRTSVVHVQRQDHRYHISGLRSHGPDVSDCCVFSVHASLCRQPGFTCDVLFSADDSSAPPDILPTSGLVGVKLRDVGPLVAWNPDDDRALLSVLDALFAIRLLHEFDRIIAARLDHVVFDISAIAHYPGIEYRLVDDEAVLLRFTVNFAKPLPSTTDTAATTINTETSSDSIHAMIAITYHISHGLVTRIDRSVDFFEDNFFDASASIVQIPSLDNTKTLQEFLVELKENVARAVAISKRVVGKKKELCLALAETFKSQLLEYDAENHTRASFYFEMVMPATSGIPGGSSPVPKKKELATAVVIFEFHDKKPPRITLMSPTRSKSGRETDYMPEFRELVRTLTMDEYLASADENIALIRSLLKTQIGIFSHSEPSGRSMSNSSNLKGIMSSILSSVTTQ